MDVAWATDVGCRVVGMLGPPGEDRHNQISKAYTYSIY